MIPEGWHCSTIGEQVTLQRGIDITRAEQRDGSIPVISSGGTSSWHDTAATKGPGVVLGRKGVVGSVYYVREDYWPHDTTLWVRDFKGNHPQFVFYFFRSIADKLAGFDVGSANPTLNRNHVHPMEVIWPDYPEQVAIADVLGSFDNKMERNRRTNQTLEGLARAIFKAWFIDFEPVRAKASGAKGFPGMPPEVFTALPTRFTSSELGLIPEGWTVLPLSKICRVISGGTPKREVPSYWGGDIPWYSVKDAPSGGMPWVYFTEENITERGLQESAATLAPIGCTIISARGTVGRLALTARPMTFNQSCYGLLALEENAYRHLYLQMLATVSEIQQRTHGSVFDTITRQTFETVSVTYPGAEMIQEFEDLVSPIFDLLLAQLQESAKLAEMRDYLLPRLLSGRVRVKEASGA